jgi:hypothetical protein
LEYRTSAWRVVDTGKDNIQTFTTIGLSSDVVLDPETTILRVDTGNSNWSIDGFAGGWPGRRFTLQNASNIASHGTLVSGGSGSTAGNTIITPNNVDRIGSRYSAILEYDGTDLIWRIVAETATDPFSNTTFNVKGQQLQHDGTNWVAQDFINIPERASAPTVTAGQGALWVQNTAPSSLKFVDDSGASWPIGFAASSSLATRVTQTANTAAITLAVLTIAASSTLAGAAFEFHGHIQVARGATNTTSNITLEFRVAGTQRFAITRGLNIIPYTGAARIHGEFSILAGPGASAAVSVVGTTHETIVSATPQVTVPTPDITLTAATNAALSIDVRASMDAAIAGVSITPVAGYIRRIA